METTKRPNMHITHRQRVTNATKKTNANLKKMIDHLREHESTSAEICALLGYSQSGGRKYINTLLAGEAMVIDRYEKNKFSHPMSRFGEMPIYRLNPDESIVAQFLAQLDGAESPSQADLAKLHCPRHAGRNIHIIADDTSYPVKVPRLTIPAPDTLLAHLFGRVVAEA